jgi:oxalate decarboxylase
MSRVSNPEPLEGNRGASILGPRNREREAQAPNMLAPPRTDHGGMPNLRFSFADAHVKMYEGGWAREVTKRELPVASTIAGVNMRLTPGGVRELHWHKQAEWSFMLAGKARITALDHDGNSFVAEVGEGDLWYFSRGIPHSIQGLPPDGCEFLLAFPDGEFSEDSTFSITDLFAHMPKGALAKNFGAAARSFETIPDAELYIFQAAAPPPVEAEAIAGPNGTRQDMKFSLVAQPPRNFRGGRVRIADASNFPASSTIAAALVEVEPGHMREIHWHPNADEWQYYIAGEARMTVFAGEQKARTFDFRAGDVGYVPMSMAHFVENTGEGLLRFLELFHADRFMDVSLAQWMALTPCRLVRDHLNLDDKLVDSIRKGKQSVF